MRGSDTIDIENRLESLITRVGEKVCIGTTVIGILTHLVLIMLSCHH